jgi:hypothetical protein
MTGAIAVKRGCAAGDGSIVRFPAAGQSRQSGEFLVALINQSLPNRKQWAKAYRYHMLG